MAAKKSAGAKPASGTPATKKAPAKTVTAKSTQTAKSTPKKTAATKTAATKAVKSAKVGSGVNGAAKKSADTPLTKPAAKSVTKSATTSPATTKTRAAPTTAVTTAPKKVAAKAKALFTKVELREFGKLIDSQLRDLQAEYDTAMIALDDLQHNRLDTAGDDPADAGNKTFEREQEMSIANNRLHLITQLQRARDRVDEGSYGLCENCGKTIPKARLQAYPSATLCVDCKAREERR